MKKLAKGTEMVETTTLSQRKARTLTNSMKSALATIEETLRYFHAHNGWVPLGYESFTEWWDSELGPIPVAIGLRNWAILKMLEEAPRNKYSGKLEYGAVGQVADAVGLSPRTIHAVATRKRQQSKITGKGDDELVPLGFNVPGIWRKHILRTASAKDVNMADLLRPIVLDGMKRSHGVDLNAPIKDRARH